MSKYVCIDGPFPNIDRNGEEIPVWGVCLMTEDDCEEKCTCCYSYNHAVETGKKWAGKNFELVIDATPWT